MNIPKLQTVKLFKMILNNHGSAFVKVPVSMMQQDIIEMG